MAPSNGKTRAVGGELIIPALAVAFTVYYFVSIRDAPWTAKVSTYLIGGILIGLVVIFVAVAAVALARGEASLTLRPLAAPAHLAPRRLVLLALTISYIVCLAWGGFTITTFVYLLLAMLVLGGAAAARMAGLLALAYALGGYVLFVAVFETRFPSGPFERLVAGLLG